MRISSPLLLAATACIPLYFLRVTVAGVPFGLPELLVFAAAAAALAEGGFTYKPGIRGWAAAALITTALASTAIAPDRHVALGILKGWILVPALFGLLLVRARSLAARPSGWDAWAAACVIVPAALHGAYAGAQFLGFHGQLPFQAADPELLRFLTAPVPRASGLTESPNYLAMALLPALALGWPLIKELIRNRRWPVAAGLGTSVTAGILASGSRGAIGALLAVGAAALAAAGTARRSRLLLAAAAGTAALLLAGAAYSVSRPRPVSQAGRERIARYAYVEIRDHPLTGIGLGGFQPVINAAAIRAQDREFTDYFLPWAYHPHNLLLSVWLQLGAVGLLAFIAVAGWSVLDGLRPGSTAASKAGAMAIAAILLHGAVDTPFFKQDLAMLFWAGVAFSAAGRTHVPRLARYRSGGPRRLRPAPRTSARR